MRNTTLRERYYEEDRLTNSNVGYPRRRFDTQDNAYNLNRREDAVYPEADRRQALREVPAVRPSRLYDRNITNEGGRLRDRGIEMPRSRYEYHPIPETRDDVERRQAAHSRLYEGRVKHQEPEAAEESDYNAEPEMTMTSRQYEDNSQVYDERPYTYNSDRQESAESRYSYYRPEAVESTVSPARNIADRYMSKYADESDLRPSTKTMQYATVKTEKEENAEKAVSNRASTKKKPSKALSMVTVYATVFIIIAILIATVGVMISTLMKDVAGMEQQVRGGQNTVTTQQSQLDNLNDNGYIYSKARDLGMREGNGEKTVKLLEVNSGEQVAKANWFDKVCDLLSSL